jgi:hypothetical protein
MRGIALLALGALLSPAAHGVELSTAARLARIRRVYVEPLTGGAVGTQMRDMLIAALEKSGLYTLTEDPEHADAVLRGSADDQIFTDTHSTSDSIGFNSHVSAASGSRSLNSGVTSNTSLGAGVNENESSRIQERRHEANASVRLVDKDGDILWSTTQESPGGKFRGAMADVADKVARNLIEQTRKVRSGDK